MRTINKIVIHYSEGNWGNADFVTMLHTAPKPKGHGWKHIGYHALIYNGYPTYLSWNKKNYKADDDGKIVNTLSHDIAGYHTLGHNQNSLAVCFIGFKTTTKQMDSLKKLLRIWIWDYALKVKDIYGHNELQPLKILSSGTKYANQCPNIDLNLLRLTI